MDMLPVLTVPLRITHFTGARTNQHVMAWHSVIRWYYIADEINLIKPTRSLEDDTCMGLLVEKLTFLH